MKKRDTIVVGLFLLVLVSVPLYWLVFPRRTFSDSERRYLSEPPKLSAASWKDWSFDDAVETYLADQLPGRDALVGLNAYTVLLSGRQVSREIWRDREGYLVEAPVTAGVDQAQKRLGRIAEDDDLVRQHAPQIAVGKSRDLGGGGERVCAVCVKIAHSLERNAERYADRLAGIAGFNEELPVVRDEMPARKVREAWNGEPFPCAAGDGLRKRRKEAAILRKDVRVAA